MLHVVFYSGSAGQRSVQSSSCGLLGKAWTVLAAREVHRVLDSGPICCFFVQCKYFTQMDALII